MMETDDAVQDLIWQAHNTDPDFVEFDAISGLDEILRRAHDRRHPRIRVLVALESKLLRGAISSVLERTPDLKVVAEVSHGDKVVSTAHREEVDIVLLDATLRSSILITDLCEKLIPSSSVLVLSDPHSTDRLCFSLARLAPQVGFMATESSPELLIDSVRRAARGEVVIDTKLALSVMIASQNPLTEREREVLRLAAEGLRSTEIAQRLFLSPMTVRDHLSRILTKTDSRTRIAAIRTAHERGWI